MNETTRDAIRIESALRELHEELNISSNESFERIGEYRIAKALQKNGAVHMNAEHDALYIMNYNAPFTQIQFDPKEVAALQSVHLFDLESDLVKASGYEFDLVTRDPHYYLPIFRAIRTRLGLPKNEAFEDFVSRTPMEKPDFEPITLPTSSANSSETNS
ncbi:MAG: hypothetical protein ACOYN2_03590 [Patescibacteria group bacterium]